MSVRKSLLVQKELTWISNFSRPAMAEYFQSSKRAPDSAASAVQIEADKARWTYPPHAVSPCPTPFSDHVVNTVNGVDIALRLFPARGQKGKRPWIFWIHGGGWTGGKHYTPNFWVVPAFRDLAGYHVVSVSYRLLPQAGIREQWADVEDSFRWARTSLSSILGGEERIDLDAYAIGGDSAGGHLATLAGLKFSPAAKAVIDVFGVVDISDPAMDIPRQIPAAIKGYGTTDQELDALMADRDLAKARIAGPWNWELEPAMSTETLQEFWGYPYIPSEEDRKWMDLNMHFVKTGKRIRTLLRRENFTTEEEYRQETRRWSPLHLLPDPSSVRDRNTAYPPTVFLHGTADMLVSIQQSKDFAKALKERQVDYKEVYCEGGSHGFEQGIGMLQGPRAPGWDEYILPVVDFVKKYLE